MGSSAAITANVLDALATGPGGNAGLFTGTGSAALNNLQSLRSGHAAVKLSDGTVLISGGTVTGSPVSSVEIYNPGSNPVTGTFANVATSLLQVRSGHTATLLSDGVTVLITGGDVAGDAELYSYNLVNPAISSSLATGSLALTRSGHTATLLPNGQVLIVGGTVAGSAVNTLEVYGATGAASSSVTGTLAYARSGHTTTLLGYTGGVATLLVAGGDAGTAELVTFDTSSNTVAQVGSAIWLTARTGHTATLLTDRSTVLFTGGVQAGANVASAELYQVPSSLTTFTSFTTTPTPTPLTVARTGHTAALLNGSLVLFTGGESDATQSAELYTNGFDPQGSVALSSSDPGDTLTSSPCALIVSGNGESACSTSLIPNAVDGGSRSISAVYSADRNHVAGGTATSALQVNLGTQQTVIVSAPTTAKYKEKNLYAIASGGSGTGAFSYSAGSSTACSVDAASGSISITSGTGTCSITATRAADANYSVSSPSAPAVVGIGLAAASVTPDAASKVYGSTDPTFTGTISGFAPEDHITATYSRTTGETVAGGPYTISATLSPAVALANYVITYNTAAFTITKAPASVTPAASTKVYGTSDPTLSGTLSGFLAADNVTSTYNRVAGQTVVGGPYTISATLNPAGVLSNYNVTYNAAAFTITAANATVTPNVATKVYGTIDPTFTGTVSGFLAADNVTASYSRSAGETVGLYSIGATLSPAAVLSNYNVTNNTAQFTISKASASVTPNAAAKVYGTSDPTLIGSLIGFLPSDGVTASYSRTTGETVAGSPYTISATLSPSGVLGNYNIIYNTAAFTISKATATVTPATGTKVYGTTDPTLTGTLVGFMASDNVTAVYSRAPGQTVLAGPYLISAALSPAGALANYNVTYNTSNFTITKASASVTPTAAAKTYGTTDPTLTGNLAGFVATDNVIASYVRVAGETVAAGPYQISATLAPIAVLSNYNIAYNTAGFTISKAPASVTPNAGTKVYGSTDTGFSGSLAGFLVADNVTASYSRVAGETVTGGPYTISAVLSPAGVLGNYAITYNTASFSITQLAASVTPSSATKVYGANDPSFSGSLSGFLAADNVTASYGRVAGETVLGGPYAISGTLSPAGVLSNYNITYNTAAFTISKAAASVAPNSATKVYGTSDPAFTGTLAGFLPSDNVTAIYSRVAGEPVGGSPYAISATLNPVGVLSNYNIVYDTANFTISKATASVTPSVNTKIYGALDPALTGTLTGFVASDNVSAVYSRVAGETVAGGPYVISAALSPAGALANYNLTYNTANFTITKAVPMVNWSNPSGITYGTALSNTQLDATSNWTIGTTPGPVAGTFTYSPAAGTVLSAGSSEPLQVSFVPSDLSNYNTPAPVSVAINVAQAAPVITWANPADIVFGSPLSGTQMNATVTSIVNGATVTVPGTITYTPSVGTILGAGSGQMLRMTFAPVDTTDYDSLSASVTINVTKATPVITWATPAAITYGTTLSGSQLNATSIWTVGGSVTPVNGTFTYVQPAGTLLSAGTGQVLQVNFAPIDSSDFNPASATTTLTVAGAPTASAMTVSVLPTPGSGGITYTLVGTVARSPIAPSCANCTTPGGTVDFYYGSTKLTSNPVPLTIMGGAVTATFTTTSIPTPVSGTVVYQLTAQYNGDTNNLGSNAGASTAAASSLVVTPNAVVSAGGAPIVNNLKLTAPAGVTLALSCDVWSQITNTAIGTAPCTINPSSSLTGTQNVTVSVTVESNPVKTNGAMTRPVIGIMGGLPVFGVLLFGLAGGSDSRKRKALICLGMALVLFIMMSLSGCGGNFSNGTPLVTATGTAPGEYVVRVIGTDSNNTQTTLAVIPLQVVQ
jgi:hypothetical protein